MSTGSPLIAPVRRGRELIAAYPLLITMMAVALGVSGAPAPLYRVYAEKWDLAPITTTVIFGVYAIAALAAVLMAGVVSDRYGRKPLLVVAMLAMLAGLGLFMVAGDVTALIIGRALHGAAVGTTVVVGSAALLDLRPDHGARTGHLTGIMFNIGMAVTILSASLLAEFGPDPLVTPYAVVAVVVLVLLLALFPIPEPHRSRTSNPIRIARPAVPAEIKAEFWFAALGVMASWSVLGVYLSLFPAFAGERTGVDSLVFGGLVVAAMAASAAVGQALGWRGEARRMAIIGDFAMAVALALGVAALGTRQAAVVVAAAVLLGLAFGLAFGGSLRYLGRVVPAGRRGEVMSAYYLLAYSAMAVPTLLAGAAATRWGLGPVFPWFTAAVAMACVGAGVLGLRSTRTALPDEESAVEIL